MDSLLDRNLVIIVFCVVVNVEGFKYCVVRLGISALL